MTLLFRENSRQLTLGIEIELQVLDKKSLLLTPRASEMVEASGSPKFKQEFFQSSLEIVTNVCSDVHEAKNDLADSIRRAIQEADRLDLTLASTGTHPVADYRDRLVTSLPRYRELIDRNQWLIRRMAVYGMHIHLGMRSGNDCISFSNFFIHFIPHVLALSASSPFWQGMLTGLSSCRPTTYEALPTAGLPYMVKCWAEFQALHSVLQKSNSIKSIRDLWWDLRPSPDLGTLELRCCDQPATLSEVLAVASFIHLLAHWFSEHQSEWLTEPGVSHWVLRENKWRALRYGTAAEIIVNDQGDTRLLSDDIKVWMNRLSAYEQQLNYSPYFRTLGDILTKGTSSQRQIRVYDKSNDLMEVVRHNVKEFCQGSAQFIQ
jgi:carboxylate-amine ligase